MFKKALLVLSIAGYVYADTGFYSTVNVTEADGSPKCQVGQMKFSNGTVTCSGQTASITNTGGGGSSLPLPAGATNYIQNTNALQSGATFYVSSGSISSDGYLNLYIPAANTTQSTERFIGAPFSNGDALLDYYSDPNSLWERIRMSNINVNSGAKDHRTKSGFNFENGTTGQVMAYFSRGNGGALILNSTGSATFYDGATNNFAAILASNTYNSSYSLVPPDGPGAVWQPMSLYNVTSSSISTLIWDSNFVINNAQTRLGIGTQTPSYPIHISQDNQVQIPRIELTQNNAGAVGRDGTINIHDNLIGTDNAFSAGWENHGTGASAHMSLSQNGVYMWDLNIGQSAICMGLGCLEGIGQAITLNHSISNTQHRTRVFVVGGSSQVDGDLFIVSKDAGNAWTEGTHVLTVNGNGRTIIGTNNLIAASSGTLSVVGASTEKWSLYVSSSNASFHLAVSTSSGHVLTFGTVPSVGTCGTNPTISGDDNQGIITMGSGGITSCVLTFANSWTANPNCVFASTSTYAGVSSRSATAVTIGLGASVTGGTLDYKCGCSGLTCT